MKKIFYLLALTSIAVAFAISCDIDNYSGPDASISGSFKDAATGELVGTDLQNGNSIAVYELGWDSEAKQTWYIQNTGEYTNNLVFAATYRVVFSSCNFYPFVIDEFVVNKGENKYDFTVTPYLRITNPSITFDSATKTIKATFGLSKGKDEVNLKEIRLFAFSDHWVGNNVKFAISDENAYKKVPSISATIDGTTTYTLSIDASAYSKDMFKYAKKYYFRIGALASVSGVGTIRHNYSPLVAIDLPKLN